MSDHYADGRDGRAVHIVFGIGSSEGFSSTNSISKIDMLPTITAPRARSQGFWLSLRGGKATIEELCMAQGFGRDEIKWQQTGISKGDFGEMIGNSMSKHVMVAILNSAISASGIADYHQ